MYSTTPRLGARQTSRRIDGRYAVWQWGDDPDPESTIGRRWLLVDVRDDDVAFEFARARARHTGNRRPAHAYRRAAA